MSNWNRPLVIAVAAVAVLAVAGGGMLAAARGPKSQSATAAAPLSPSPTPLPLKVAVDATQLSSGREPQMPYLRGRTLLGGAAGQVKVPGTTNIQAIARLWDTTLALEIPDAKPSSLTILDEAGKPVQRVPGIDSLVTSPDGNAVAYGAGGTFGITEAGTTVYFRTTDGRVLSYPNSRARDTTVLTVLDRSVFISSRPEDSDAPTLYRWDADWQKTQEYPKVMRPVAVSADGSLAAGLPVFTDSGLCSVVTDLAKDRQLWRSCQHRLTRFSPGNAFVVGFPPNAGSPYGDESVTALDAKTGKVLRVWTGRSLRNTVPEDDDHVLIEWHDKAEPQSRSAVVRCTVSTGQCELASPLSPEPLLLGS